MNHDPWLALDKVGHFIFCLSTTIATYVYLVHKNFPRIHRFLAAILVSGLLGGLKEVGDALGWWPGNASVRDMGADVIGIAVGAVVVIVYEPQLLRLFKQLAKIESQPDTQEMSGIAESENAAATQV